jgi:hypothetical protein
VEGKREVQARLQRRPRGAAEEEAGLLSYAPRAGAEERPPLQPRLHLEKREVLQRRRQASSLMHRALSYNFSFFLVVQYPAAV